MKKIVLILLTLSSLNYSQRIIRVPQDYVKIQDALNNAQPGDKVTVDSGSYKENIIWPNVNGITLTGLSKELTFINGANLASSIIINPLNSNIDSTTVISNISIINGGNSTKGGGIMIINSSPKLMNIIVSGNNSSSQGGGIYFKNSNVKIIHSSIINNNSSVGGGIYVDASVIYLIGNNITRNKGNNGAGISCNATIKIDSSVISSNIAQSNGGGIYLSDNSNCTITNSTINDNQAPNLGGGICNYGGITVVDNTVLEKNFSYNGGGIYDSYSSNKTTVMNSLIINQVGSVLGAGVLTDHNLEIQNTVFAYNLANSVANANNTEGGGIVAKNHATINVTNSSFIGNYAKKDGGGLSLSENVSVTLQNCTFSANVSPKGAGMYVNGINNYILNNNNFIKNGSGIINDDNTVYIAATNNYWGHSSGSYNPNNKSGLGDTTNYFVNTIPFLTSSNNNAPLPPPTNLKVISATSTSIDISWDFVPINNLSGYNLYFNSLSSGRPYSFKINVGNNTSYQLQNLLTGHSYYLVITTYDSNGKESWYSKEINASTLPLTPNAPVATSATSIGKTYFTANWNLANGATGYYLDVSTNNNFTSFVTGLNNKDVGNATTYLVNNLTPNTSHYYRARAYNAGGSSLNSNIIGVTLVGIENQDAIPKEFELSQNYPNPFNPETVISYQLPIAGNVTLKVYDILGREVAVLVNEEKFPGSYEIKFDGSALSSGIYFYKLQAGVYTQIKKMIILK